MLALNHHQISPVSVVIPTYNRKHFVKGAIESVLNQSYTDYELIVVDDASTDGTADWISAIYPHIRLVRLLENRGAAGARNKATRIAKGNFIAFLDSDDRWLPNYLEKQVKTLHENSLAVLSYSNCTLLRKDNCKDYYNLEPKSIYPDLIHHLLMKPLISTMSIVVVRRDALVNAGLLSENLKICHDRELYLRLLYLGEFVHVPENLVVKVQHSGNIASDYRLWVKEAMMLLDMFFSDERSEPYKHLETRSRIQWLLNIAKVVGQGHHDLPFACQILARAFNLSIVGKIQEFRRLLTQNSVSRR